MKWCWWGGAVQVDVDDGWATSPGFGVDGACAGHCVAGDDGVGADVGLGLELRQLHVLFLMVSVLDLVP